MSKFTEREETLLKTLGLQKRLSVSEVTAMFGISEATARRIFTELEKQGKLIRTYGGVTLIPEGKLDYSFALSEQKNGAEKSRIGMKAVEFVEDGNVIFLDSGTTVLRLALSLKEVLLAGKMLSDITVVTNSLANIEALGTACKVVSVGGDYREKRKDFAGYLSEKAVSNLRFASCFLGTDAIHISEGFMTSDVDSARFYESVILRSEKCFVLADADKFNCSSFLAFAPLDKASAIITDTRLSAETRELFAKLNPNILAV